MILDIAPGHTNGLFLGVDRDRNLSMEKFRENIDLKKFLKAPAQKAIHASWEGKHVFESRRRIAVAADSSLATTIPVPLEFCRGTSERDRRITSFELEEAIAHAMVKIVPQCRAEAAERFKADLLSVVLVGAKAKHFVIDGKPAPRPVGFVGDRVALMLELTFAARELFDDFREFFSAPEPFFFVESPQACLSAVARVRPLPVNLVAYREGAAAALRVLDAPKEGYPVLYREPFAWPFEHALKELQDRFSVSRAAAMDIYAMYCAGRLSQDAVRGLRPHVEPYAELFFKEVEKARIRGASYIDAPYAMPFAMPLRKGNASFEEIPIVEILRKVGLAMAPGEPVVPDHVLFRHLGPFVEMYFDRDHSELNENLRRRLHWLAH